MCRTDDFPPYDEDAAIAYTLATLSHIYADDDPEESDDERPCVSDSPNTE